MQYVCYVHVSKPMEMPISVCKKVKMLCARSQNAARPSRLQMRVLFSAVIRLRPPSLLLLFVGHCLACHGIEFPPPYSPSLCVTVVVVRSWVDADACVAERARPLAVPVGLAEAHRAHGPVRVRLDADFREVVVVVAAARVLALEALDDLACWRRRRDLRRGALGLSRLRDGHAGDGSGQGELGCEEEERAQGGDRVEEGLGGRLVRRVLVARANGMGKHG